MEQLDSNIFNFAYEMALRDATLQGAYKGTDKKKLRENSGAKAIVEEYIKAIFDGKQPCFYKTEAEVEESFIAFIDDNKLTIDKEGTPAVFTFGNAQKLINMTAKYMYIAAYQNDDLREKFNCCHCPMDSVMVETVIREIGSEKRSVQKSGEQIENMTKRRNGITWRQYLRQSWSKISSSDREQYDLFQEMITFLSEKEQISPIEFDFNYWAPSGERNASVSLETE